METGESNTPSREVVASIVRSLQLESADVDKLFFAAGYLTPGFEKLGYGDTTISSVIRILGDERMTNEALADVRAVLETICARWSNNDDAPKDLPKSARLAVVVGSRTIRSVEKRASI